MPALILIALALFRLRMVAAFQCCMKVIVAGVYLYPCTVNVGPGDTTFGTCYQPGNPGCYVLIHTDATLTCASSKPKAFQWTCISKRLQVELTYDSDGYCHIVG